MLYPLSYGGFVCDSGGGFRVSDAATRLDDTRFYTRNQLAFLILVTPMAQGKFPHGSRHGRVAGKSPWEVTPSRAMRLGSIA